MIVGMVLIVVTVKKVKTRLSELRLRKCLPKALILNQLWQWHICCLSIFWGTVSVFSGNGIRPLAYLFPRFRNRSLHNCAPGSSLSSGNSVPCRNRAPEDDLVNLISFRTIRSIFGVLRIAVRNILYLRSQGRRP